MASQFNPPSSVSVGNTLFVDAVNGNDATGVVGSASKPYLTLAAAKTAAASGQLVWVRPGSYVVTDTILKNGVNWNFDAGASVTKTQTSGSIGIIDDAGASITSTVYGQGDFLHIVGAGSDTGCVKVSNSASVIVVHARTIAALQNAGFGAIPCAVYQAGGTLRVRASNSISAVDNSGNGFGVTLYWGDGTGEVYAPSIFGSNSVVWSQSDGSSSQNFYVECSEMYSTDTVNDGVPGVIVCFTNGGSSANAAIWVKADTIRANAGSAFASVYTWPASANKIYVNCQKLYGTVQCEGANLVYVTAEKSEAISNVTGSPTSLFASATAGTLRLNLKHCDPKAFTGIGFLVNGGTLIANEAEYTSGSGSDGLSISSGTARLQTCILNTAANASGFPIAKSGGTLILMACTLVSNGSVKSINSGTAQNVVAMSSWANNAVSSNVTITTTGGLTVNSAVA